MIRGWIPAALAAIATLLMAACVSLPEQVREELECVANSAGNFGDERCARE
jgi:hypothetical protein